MLHITEKKAVYLTTLTDLDAQRELFVFSYVGSKCHFHFQFKDLGVRDINNLRGALDTGLRNHYLYVICSCCDCSPDLLDARLPRPRSPLPLQPPSTIQLTVNCILFGS